MNSALMEIQKVTFNYRTIKEYVGEMTMCYDGM